MSNKRKYKVSDVFNTNKHCFRKSEGYHMWANRNEYGYYKSTYRHSYCFVNGYLFTGDNILADVTTEKIKHLWDSCYKRRCIAIINHKYKMAVINNDYGEHIYDVENAIPKDYKIFHIDDNIPYFDIFEKEHRKELFILSAKYMTNKFVQYNSHIFVNNQERRNMYLNMGVNKYSIDNIKTWIKDNKLKHTIAYTHKCSDFLVSVYKGWSYNRCIIIKKKLSIKDIIEDKWLTDEERQYMDMSRFYALYCYGYGISKKFVRDNWNKRLSEVNLDSIINKLDKRIINHMRDKGWFEDESKQYVKDLLEDYGIQQDIFNRNWINAALKESNINREIALKEFYETHDRQATINNWRNRNAYKYDANNYIEYNKFIYRINGNVTTGRWIRHKEYLSFNNFSNKQLRLTKDKRYIETNAYCKVPFDDVIRLFSFIMTKVAALRQYGHTRYTFDGRFMIGMYRLISIHYDTKVTDRNIVVEPETKQWCITIGCHRLWFDDIQNFINYYSLNDKINIPAEFINNNINNNNNK